MDGAPPWAWDVAARKGYGSVPRLAFGRTVGLTSDPFAGDTLVWGLPA